LDEAQVKDYLLLSKRLGITMEKDILGKLFENLRLEENKI
jgi:hypothetical protein